MKFRHSHVSSETVRAIASGKFPQKDLGQLSAFRANEAVRSLSSQHSRPQVPNIPDLSTFLSAWSVYIDILQDARPDLPIALIGVRHLGNIAALSKVSSWPNVLQYHMKFVEEREKDETFSLEKWSEISQFLRSSYCPSRGLLRLDDDMILLIYQHLRALEDGYATTSVTNFATACRRINLLLQSRRFYDIMWPGRPRFFSPGDDENQEIPLKILKFIKCLWISQSETTDLNVLTDVLPYMTSLTKAIIYFRREELHPSFGFNLLAALSKIAGLQSLSVTDLPVDIFFPYDGFSKLDDLAILSSERDFYSDVKHRHLPHFLSLCSPRLVKLHLSSALVAADIIADMMWPCLKQLVYDMLLFNVSEFFPQSLSLVLFSRNMPELRTLHLIPEPVGPSYDSLFILDTCPASLWRDVATDSSLPDPVNVTNIIVGNIPCPIVTQNSQRHLPLPVALSDTFARLPHGVKSLSVLSGSYDADNGETRSQRGLDETDAISIMKELRSVVYDRSDYGNYLTTQNPESLRHLTLRLDLPPTVSLLQVISSRFPLLEKLELSINKFYRSSSPDLTPKQLAQFWIRLPN